MRVYSKLYSWCVIIVVTLSAFLWVILLSWFFHWTLKWLRHYQTFFRLTLRERHWFKIIIFSFQNSFINCFSPGRAYVLLCLIISVLLTYYIYFFKERHVRSTHLILKVLGKSFFILEIIVSFRFLLLLILWLWGFYLKLILKIYIVLARCTLHWSFII